MYKLFEPRNNRKISRGWDTYAYEYSQLPHTNITYRLGKEFLYKALERNVLPYLEEKPPKKITVLDFNCGSGNDFEFFLKKGYNVVGCDGSFGMLLMAYRRYKRYIDAGRVVLYLGRSEELSVKDFSDYQFDFIFSTTGGFSYVNDSELVREHLVLSKRLADSGLIFTAHLTPYCGADTLYYLYRGNIKAAFFRWKKKVNIIVKNQPLTMYLRSYLKIHSLLKPFFHILTFIPLLIVMPPFQTGYRASRKNISLNNKLEYYFSKLWFSKFICDQIGVLCRPKKL